MEENQECSGSNKWSLCLSNVTVPQSHEGRGLFSVPSLLSLHSLGHCPCVDDMRWLTNTLFKGVEGKECDKTDF